MKHLTEMNADEMRNHIVHLECVLSQIYDDLYSARDISGDYDEIGGHALVVLLHDAERLAKEALGKQ